MRTTNFLTVLMSLLLSVAAFADRGGWVSSGGEVFKTGKNPWWVKNTTEIHYCVHFAENEFTPAKADVLGLIEQSIQYWKNQLDGASSLGLDSPGNPLGNEKAKIATQVFTLNPTCLGTEELTFKFGYSTLDKEELEHIKTPENFIGLTIRKNYDEVNLKGSGIIFVSGDLGKNSYKKTSKDVIDQAWKYSRLLQYVLIHELGHVFGLPHSGSGLMSEVFLDQLLIRKFAALYVREPILPMLKPAPVAEICDADFIPSGTQNFLAPYFSLKHKEDCLRLQLSENKKEFQILTKKSADTQNNWKQIGLLSIDKNELVDYSLKPAVVVQLTEQQKVFQALDSAFIMGPLFQNYKVDGHINFGTSLKPYSVQIDISPDSIVVYGMHENKIRQIFSFGNPLLFGLSKPF